MPDIGTMHQLNPEPPHIGTMHQLGPEPLHTGEIITPQAQAEEYAREAQESAANAALSAAAAQSAAETAQQAAESIAPALDEKADAIHTAAGPAPIVSIPDAAAAPVDALTVGIEPVQDLHGYDNPWPAGGGVNKINLGSPCTFTTTKDQPIVTISQGTAWVYRDSFSYTTTPASGAKNPYVVFYDENDNVVGGIWVNPSAKASSVSLTGDAVKVRIYSNGYSYGDSNGVEVTITGLVISTTEVSAYAPYSNICPISGFDGLTVTRTGKNLYDISRQTVTNDNTFLGVSPKPNTDYVFSTDKAITGLYVAYSDDETMPSQSKNTGWTDLKTVYNNTFLSFNSGSHKWLRLMTYESGGRKERTLQLELGTTATAYEPYQGETYPITFPSEAGTVYGGELAIAEDGSGVLTVDRAQIASYNGETLPGEWISDRDVYAAGTTPSIGAQVVYELATPITYQLTPQEIRTFLGANNIWADTGDVTVGYKADTKLYIDKKFAELQALILEN